MTAPPRRLVTTLVLLLLTGYLVFGYAFMQLRIPPVGFGVPLGEVMLAMVLVSLNLPAVIARMGVVVPLVPVLVLWLFGFTRLALDALQAGPWAFRDGTQLIETLYLIVGFALFAHPSERGRAARWIRRMLVAACLYGLLFVWGNELRAVSPTLPGGSDQAIPIIGFSTTVTMMLWGAFYCMIHPARTPASRWGHRLVAAFLVSFAIIVIQARTTYVQLAAMTFLLLLVRPAALRGLALCLPIFAFLVFLISVFDLNVSGRLSSKISFEFFWDHIQAMVGISETDHEGVAEAASGVDLRLGWWLRLYHELTSDLPTLLTGLGFGVPLTDFRDSLGVPTREPHNSIISIVARLGLVGGACWIWLQVELIRNALRAYRACRRMGRLEEGHLAFMILGFAVLTLSSCLAEDIMEKPYNAVPYYLLCGIALRISYSLRASPSRSVEPSTALGWRGTP